MVSETELPPDCSFATTRKAADCSPTRGALIMRDETISTGTPPLANSRPRSLPKQPANARVAPRRKSAAAWARVFSTSTVETIEDPVGCTNAILALPVIVKAEKSGS